MATLTTGQKILNPIAAIASKPTLQSIFNPLSAIFGSKYSTSTGVRWLTQMYQYFVLGQGNVTSDNKVDEKQTEPAQMWFYGVLGVPVFDKYRWHALAGTDPDHDTNLNQSDSVKAINYMKYPEVQTWAKQVPDPNGAVMNAIQIVKNMNDRSPAGSWANMQATQFGVPSTVPTIDNTVAQTIQQMRNQAGVGANTAASGLTPVVGPSGNLVDPVTGLPVATTNPNLKWWIIGGIAALLLVTVIVVRHKSSAS